MTNIFRQLSNNSRAIILAITGFTAFSVADAGAKWLTLSYPPVQVIGVIAVFSFFTALLFSPLLGGLRQSLQTKKLHVHMVRGVLNIIISLLAITAFSKLSIALVYTLIFVAPFLTTMMAIPVYGERVHRSGWIAVAGGFLGVLVVLHPGFTDINFWLFLPLAAAFFIALLFLTARALMDSEETLISLALFPVTANLLLITPLAITFYGFPSAVHLPFFAVSGVSVVIGLACSASAFRLAPASLISPFMYLQMIMAVVFGYFIFGDIPGPWTLTGAGIIIASGIYLIETERRIASIIKIP